MAKKYLTSGKAKPCITCGHMARDHQSKGKKTNGTWWRECLWDGCECKQYIMPSYMI